MDWDDFRLVRAIAESGGLTRAAEQLGINPSTAFRRLAGIEAALDTTLFDRHRAGYAPTAAGLAMMEAAARMAGDVERFTRELAGQDQNPAGELRITAPASLVADMLMPSLARFTRRYPRIRLDLVVAEEALNLSRRDADVALRASDAPPPTLVGRRLATIAWAIYGRADFAGRPFGECPWIVPGESVAGGRFVRFAQARAASDRIVLTLNTVLGLREAVEAGLGIGPLPRWSADGRPDLVRLSDHEPDLSTGLWLLTHPDLRHAARVRAFMNFMAEEIAILRPRIEGSLVSASPFPKAASHGSG
ncbi:LysR family transcriptional regulator [Methylobacterium sp. J-090]|uniref:LysR family transcriptional regulator n=1 Tax=Methylobacterium sp. J-090 TaxID=2836666 RepID=UPI001FBADD3C|nr:LysR family transcriptional regulator [Methylobacterium sp. J-090]MCJ2083172.1 LysR family transcriptional regulator [Methylobacterium sp. J-090]